MISINAWILAVSLTLMTGVHLSATTAATDFDSSTVFDQHLADSLWLTWPHCQTSCFDRAGSCLGSGTCCEQGYSMT